jgi:hypothetical protein
LVEVELSATEVALQAADVLYIPVADSSQQIMAIYMAILFLCSNDGRPFKSNGVNRMDDVSARIIPSECEDCMRFDWPKDDIQCIFILLI